jgi:hypothetical protein
MVPFDKPILLGVMWITEYHCDSERVTRAHQGSREVTALGCSYESRVSRSRVMEVGKPCGAERLGHSGKGGFCGKIGAHMVSHQHGGACIDDIEFLDHVLLFAMGIRRDAGGVECASSCQCGSGAGRSSGSVTEGKREAMRPFSFKIR